MDNQKCLKRLMDVLFAGVGTLVTFPIIFIAFFIISIETKSFGLYFSKRIGKHGKPFTMVKIRTMVPSAKPASSVTTIKNPRITKIGRFLRKTKLDELPQLWNVLIGNMSLVGPRPDVPGFADKLTGEERIILSIRPGITGPASLHFKNEEELLAQQENPEQYNREVIWPKKVAINKEYIQRYSLWKDIRIIIKTIF